MELFLVLFLSLVTSGFGSLDSANIEETPLRVRRSETENRQKLEETMDNLMKKAKKITGPILPSLAKLTAEITKLSLSPDEAATWAKAIPVADSLNKNWDALSGNDTMAIAKAICDVAAAAGAALAPPPYGAIISGLAGLVSGLISANQDKPRSMGDVMKQVVEEQLTKQYNKELINNIRGAIRDLTAAQNFLNSYADENGAPTEHEFTFISGQVKILRHEQLRGAVLSHIGDLAQSKKRTEVADAVKLIDLYIMLSSAIELQLHTMISLFDDNPKDRRNANAVRAVIGQSRIDNADGLYFVRNPKPENGIFFLAYDQKPIQSVETMLDSLGITTSLEPFKGGCYKMLNKKGKKYFAYDRQPANVQFFRGKFAGYGPGTFSLKTGESLVCAGLDANAYFDLDDTCSEVMPRNKVRVYPFIGGGYMLVNLAYPTNPLWLRSYVQGIFGSLRSSYGVGNYALRLSAEDKDKSWNEEKPEYVWELEPVTCDVESN